MGSQGRLLRGGVISAMFPVREGDGQAERDDIVGAQRIKSPAHGWSHWGPQAGAPPAVSGASLSWEGRTCIYNSLCHSLPLETQTQASVGLHGGAGVDVAALVAWPKHGALELVVNVSHMAPALRRLGLPFASRVRIGGSWGRGGPPA